MNQEDFPIDIELVEKFINENKRQWEDIEHTDKYIYLNFSMVRMQTPWIVPKLIYAKGLENVSKAKPVALTWRPNKEVTRFIESFGIEHVAIDKLIKKDFLAFLQAGFKTAFFMIFNGSGKGLKKVKACGVSAGKSLYEDIIRTSNLSTIKSARNKICTRKMFHILWAVYGLSHYMKKHKPEYGVADDLAYHEGLILKVLKRHGAEVFASNYEQEREVRIDKEYNIETIASYMKNSIQCNVDRVGEEGIIWSENHLKERFKGNNGREIDRQAFAGKRVIDRCELISKYKLDSDKKNIVIMAHTFTDAVFNYGDLYFRDYYDWVEKTLQIATNVKNVNWILKPHPTRGAYNESVDSIEKLFEKYKQDNMVILSDDVSAESIINFADAQLTIGGNSGAEFSCFGIPTVIVGKPYYCGFGYTIEPSSYDEYKELLTHMDEIKPLTDEQIIKAKKVFYLRYNDINSEEPYMYKDEFANLINSEYSKLTTDLKTIYHVSNEGSKSYNNNSLKAITDYISKNDMKQTQYYSRAKYRASNN